MTVNRTYYMILGVHPHESQAGIRSAFHHLASRYHPDRAGPRGTPLFQEMVEAYLTLSDPDRRQDYDRGLAHQEPRETPPTVRVAPPRVAAGQLVPEPLVPEPIGFLGDVGVSHPPAHVVRRRIRSRFAVAPPARPRRVEVVEVDVVLDPDLAWRGGRLRIGVPVAYPCPRCLGEGHGWAGPCLACEATGMVEAEESVSLFLPPGVAAGDRFAVPLGGLGIHDLQLVVRVHVGG